MTSNYKQQKVCLHPYSNASVSHFLILLFKAATAASLTPLLCMGKLQLQHPLPSTFPPSHTPYSRQERNRLMSLIPFNQSWYLSLEQKNYIFSLQGKLHFGVLVCFGKNGRGKSFPPKHCRAALKHCDFCTSYHFVTGKTHPLSHHFVTGSSQEPEVYHSLLHRAPTQDLPTRDKSCCLQAAASLVVVLCLWNSATCYLLSTRPCWKGSKGYCYSL